MILWGKTRRINKVCLITGVHDWDIFGHPNWICNRPGCTVRGDDLTEADKLKMAPLPPRCSSRYQIGINGGRIQLVACQLTRDHVEDPLHRFDGMGETYQWSDQDQYYTWGADL